MEKRKSFTTKKLLKQYEKKFGDFKRGNRTTLMKHTILVATTNPGKMRELAEMFSELAGEIEWHSLRDYPNTTEVEEDGATFSDNAAKKALGYARQTGLWTIADDSGLVVDALDGRPGVCLIYKKPSPPHRLQ
jgi:XTP/dITP diphosphohydrolase